MPNNIQDNQNHFNKWNKHCKKQIEHHCISVNTILTNTFIQHNQEHELHESYDSHSSISSRRDQCLKDSWTERYTQLKEFNIREGHSNVPFRFKENRSLGIWVSNQRKAYHRYMNGQSSHLTQGTIEKLEEIGFIWHVKEDHGKKWMEQYEKLKRFKHVHNHCCVPQHYTNDESLGMWVSQQRQQYKKWRDGKDTNITKWRIELLKEIGFKWNAKTGNISNWMVHYKNLKKFKACTGHCNVSKHHSNNPRLGKWVEVQQNEYSKLKNKDKSHMTQLKIELLNDIGFKWKISKTHNGAWEKRYNQLKEFKSQKGHCNVPQKYEMNPSLGVWVSTQRQEYKKYCEGMASRMTESRLKELENIDFSWSTKKCAN
mmetsp:Transcript_26733/g.32420  ORF Transcript_26733/g.32420 Transcript_26733/m.32420 type:complete len:371 (+) Transcript_26733:152-1264(+)